MSPTESEPSSSAKTSSPRVKIILRVSRVLEPSPGKGKRETPGEIAKPKAVLRRSSRKVLLSMRALEMVGEGHGGFDTTLSAAVEKRGQSKGKRELRGHLPTTQLEASHKRIRRDTSLGVTAGAPKESAQVFRWREPTPVIEPPGPWDSFISDELRVRADSEVKRCPFVSFNEDFPISFCRNEPTPAAL